MDNPFDQETITVNQAIDWVVSKVYPNTVQRVAVKRVRARIMYAANKGDLKLSYKSDDTLLEADVFVKWAGTKWAELKPPEHYVLKAETGKFVLTRSPIEIIAPSDFQDIDRMNYLYFKKCEQVQGLREVIGSLNAEILRLRRELADWRSKDAETRRKKSVAGKKGGRGKSF